MLDPASSSQTLSSPLLEAAEGAANREEPVTVLISRRIKSGGESDYEKRLQELCELLSAREGFREMKAYQPGVEGDEFKAVLMFDTPCHLRAWQESPQREKWLQSVKSLEAAPPRAQILTGLESWFTLPSQEGMPPPPKHKMAVVTWLGIFPIVLFFSTLVQPLLENWPTILRSAVMTALTVSLMTYFVMPRITRVCAKFLYPEIELSARKEQA